MIVMEPKAKKTGGRPRGFDRAAVLETAMRLFWRHGYDGVSFQQLTGALGLSAPSLYAAFGNKEALYREALDLYAASRPGADLGYFDGCGTLVEAARELLEGTARGLTQPGAELGCMLNTGMLTSHPEQDELARELSARRVAFRRLLASKLEHFTDPDHAAALARYLTAIMQGMAVQARDGATREELVSLAQGAVAMLPDKSPGPA
jgi:TetR/AcrR family transcriptional regulator, copper-responsive repressor